MCGKENRGTRNSQMEMEMGMGEGKVERAKGVCIDVGSP